MKILDAIKNRISAFSETTAEAIESGDWRVVIRNATIAALVVIGILSMLLLLLLGLWKLIGTLIGKALMTLLGAPIVVFILWKSYCMNLKDSRRLSQIEDKHNHLEAWAEEIYGYVRDGMFLVLRAVSEYTVIVMPSTPSAVELPNNISVKDGYVVFHFFARVRDVIDPVQLKRDLNRTLNQMLRAHELKGIPSDLVRINGAYYSPLQILDIIDYGDSINIAVVFTDEKTIGIAKAKKQLNIEYQNKQKSGIREPLYEDEL